MLFTSLFYKAIGLTFLKTEQTSCQTVLDIILSILDARNLGAKNNCHVI